MSWPFSGATQIWRDFVTDGVPSSGKRGPDRSEIRSWGEDVERRIDAYDSLVTVTATVTGSTGSPNTLTNTAGAATDARNNYIDITDGGDLGGTVYYRLDPNTDSKICYIRNSLSGSRDLILFQGTFSIGRALTISPGVTEQVVFPGTGATSTLFNLSPAVWGTTIDDTVIGGVTPRAVTGSTLRATSIKNVTLASTAHAFQIGHSAGGNLAVNDNQIQARSNGSAATLNINTLGGNVSFGGGTVSMLAVDIDSGAVDGTVIGASSAAAGTFTEIEVGNGSAASPSVQISTTANGFYHIDSTQIGVAMSGAEEARFQAGLTNGTDDTVQTRQKADARYLALSGGTMTGTITSVDINSGAIDGTTIGASTPATGSFSTATIKDIFPRLRMNDTDGTANARRWQQDVVSGIMFLRPVDDSYVGSGTDYYRFNRSISLSNDQDVVVRGTGDARYLSDTRLGTERTTTSSLPAGVAGTLAVTAPSGSVITSVSIEKDASGEVLELIVKDRPVQKYINGAWTTVSVV